MIYIHGMGHFHPETVIDNGFLESLDIGVDSHWVLERVGIRERRTVLSLDYIRHTRNQDPRAAAESSAYSNAETAMFAARQAIANAGVRNSDIGMVIAGGCSPQLILPPEAFAVAETLGIDVPAVDLNSGCSTFAAQIHWLNLMSEGSLPDFVLLVNSENTTRCVSYNDPSTAVLAGDGSSAAVISARVPARTRVVATCYECKPSAWRKIQTPVGGHFFQDGPAVQLFAIRRTLEIIRHLSGQQAVSPSDMTFVGHQSNLLILESVCKRARIHTGAHRFNVDRFGNCGAAGAPSVLSENWHSVETRWLSMAVVGAGLSWAGLLLDMGTRI